MEFPGETAVIGLQLQECVQNGGYFPFQSGMFAAMLFFVMQVVEQCINTFALTADAENIGFGAAFEIDELPDETSGGESVAFVAVERLLCYVGEIGAAVFVSVFEGVERIEQHPSYEADFRTAVGLAVGCAELFSGHVFQRITIHISRCEIACQRLLHPFVRIGWFGGLRQQTVVAVFPGIPHELGKIRGRSVAEFPAEDDRRAFGQVLVGPDRRSQREFTDIAIGGLLIGESEAERSPACDVLEARESDRRIAREHHLSAFVGRQSIAAGAAYTQHRVVFSAGGIEDARQRSAETVFADSPAVGRVE